MGLDGILLSKVENLWAQNVQGSFVSWQWRMIQNLKRKWLVSSKLTWGIWPILTWALENLKNLHFDGLLFNKVYNVCAKKSLLEFWFMVWNTDATLKENWHGFQKLHEEFSKFSPDHVWKSKNWDFDGILLSKVEYVWVSIVQGSFVSWQWRMIQNLRRNWLVSSILT